jgi:hypothetical protein
METINGNYNTSKLRGFEIDEIEEVANDLLSTLQDLQCGGRLGSLGLLRAVVRLCDTDDDLDMCCRLLDELAIFPHPRNQAEDFGLTQLDPLEV